MPTPKKGPRLGSGPAHQKAMLANLATSLFEHGRITTTEAKARALRPVAERLITKAKKAPLDTVESLHNRRLVLRTIRDKSVVHELFTSIAPQFAERPGGYTRITKLGPRKGDNAPMAVIELVTEPYEPKQRQERPAPAQKSAQQQAQQQAQAPAAEVVEADSEAAPAEVEAPTAGTEETEVLEAQPTTDDVQAAEAEAAPAEDDEAPAEDDKA